MVDLVDAQPIGPPAAAQCERIEPGAEDHVLLDPSRFGRIVQNQEFSLGGQQFGPDGVGIAALVGPLVGGAIGVAATTLKIAGTSVRRRDVGIEQIRKRLEDALGKCEKPIVVILDDVDRLTSNEIAELFRLVRLVARFPNVIYVMACDRDQVTSVLDHQGGARYLEKIIQIPFNLPEVSRHKLEGQVRVRIEESLGPRGSGLDDDAIPSVVDDVILPLIRKIRNVNQYISIVLGTVIALKTKVAPADVLGLEAIRVFLPQVRSAWHALMVSD